MNLAKRYYFSITLALLAFNLPAQNLTGTWEGEMGTYQFLQLNIIQNGDKICGYSWDNITNNKTDYCKALFEARFNKKSKVLQITGTSFLANSGTHTLMELELSHKYVNDEDVLYYTPTLSEKIMAFIAGAEVETAVYLKKVSDQPTEVLEGMKDCLDEEKKDIPPKIITPEKPKNSIPETVKIITPEKSKDSLPPVKAKDSIAAPKAVTQRKNIEQSRLEINVKTINLKVYDNAIVDGDTVSIFYNGKLLLSHQLLSEKAIEFNIELDEKQPHHEIVLFAENLGSIPPNTALIVITAGEKRYELFASASLEENAVLVFEYRPK